ncbi:MAG: hypothetical protein JSW58_07965 [Candidatus Latescibacterota bacterium]|nr:MAG: hypothetical protein JSW58_07965 [Candidatus Latescibacterota bacterium]
MADFKGMKQEATVRDFLNVVFRWKFLILSIVLLTVFFIVYMKASKPLTYVSSSRLLVKRGERENVFTPNPRYLSWAEEMSSQLEVVLSEAVFSSARKIFADSLAARNLEGTRSFKAGAVRADVVGESNVIIISYSGLDPVECELGCKAETQAYIEYYKTRSSPPAVKDFFESEIDEALHQLAQWRQRKSEFLRREAYVGVEEEGSHQMYKLGRLELSLAEVKSDLSAQAIRVQNLRELAELSEIELVDRISVMALDIVARSRNLTDIRSEMQKLETRREDLLTIYTDRHPDVISVDNQLGELRGRLKQEVVNIYEQAYSEYEELLAKQATLTADLEKTQAAIGSIPDKEKELSRIESEITAYQEKYQLLLEKQHEAEIAIASSTEFEVTILTPPGKAWPRRSSDIVRLAMGPFLALIVGLGLAFFFESMDHSLKNTAEVEEYLGSTVLATISEVRKKD